MVFKSKEKVIAAAETKISNGLDFSELNNREKRLYGEYLTLQQKQEEQQIEEEKTLENDITINETNKETRQFKESINFNTQLLRLQGQLQQERKELNNAKNGQGKVVRKAVREYFNKIFDNANNRIKETTSGKYTNLDTNHIKGLIAKSQLLLQSARDYKSQLVTGDIDEARRFFPPNIFDDTNFYMPDVVQGQNPQAMLTPYQIGAINSNPEGYINTNCKPNPQYATDTKDAFEKGGILGMVDYRGAKSNLDPKMRGFARGAGFLGLVGLSFFGIRKLYKSLGDGARWKTPAILVGGSIGLNMLSGSMTGKPFGLTDIFKGFVLGKNDLPKRLLSIGHTEVAGSGSQKENQNKTALETMQPTMITSALLRDIPFGILSQSIDTPQGPQTILNSNNNAIQGINILALETYILHHSNKSENEKQDRLAWIKEYKTKSTEEQKLIQQQFTQGLDDLSITHNDINNHPERSLTVYYKDKLNKLSKNAIKEEQEEQKANTGPEYNGIDNAKSKEQITIIKEQIKTNNLTQLESLFTADFVYELEKKINILYNEHPNARPISLTLNPSTQHLELNSYGQKTSINILNNKNSVLSPHSIEQRNSTTFDEAINIAQLTNLLTAPTPVGFAGASTETNPFNLSYTETERDIEFSKTDRWTAMKNLSVKQGIDTNILEDTRENNFDEKFSSINNNKEGFISWLNNFKHPNGKSLWQKQSIS